MATDQQYKRPYPRAQSGHQMYAVRTHGMADIRVGHRPNLTHSATSAFRPAGMPQVPLQQRLVSPGVIPSNHEQYHQQQIVPCGSSRKHVMQLELQQKQKQQQQQQHIFRNMPLTNPVNKFQQDLHQRAAPKTVVQAVAPVQYPPLMQQYGTVQENSDREILHQELRMLHAVHYQDINRKDELMETYWKQKLADDRKQRSQAAGAHHAIYDAQRKSQSLSDSTAILRKKFIEESRTYGHQAQQMYSPKQEELYQARKARVPVGSAVAPTHPQMSSYGQRYPETHVRLDGAMTQSVPHPHFVQAIKESASTGNNFVGRPGDYHNYQVSERYGAPQQYQTRFPGQGVVMQHHQPVQRTHQEVFQIRRKQRNFPTQLHATNLMHPAVQPQPHKQPSVSLQYCPDVIMVSEEMEQVPVVSQITQLKQETVDKQAPVARRMHNLSGQLLKNEICGKEEKKNYADNDSKESRRLSKMAVSIREEQMQLKEVLEKSLHRAAVQSIQKEVKKNTKDSLSHVVADSVSDMESMPRIVEVRSLANQELTGAVSVAHSDASKGIVHGVSSGDVLGNNLKPSKPKSLMIKSHQELQDLPVNVNRVPSIGSMDSDNGRKDSWDSGIESPPWPENREACVMNMKRAASFPCDDISSVSMPHQDQKVKLVEKKQSDNSIVNVGLDLSGSDQTNILIKTVQSVKESSVACKGNSVLCNSSPETSHRKRQLSSGEVEKRSASGSHIRMMNRKRSWPVDDLCPVEPKVLNKDPHALELRREHSMERISLKSQPIKATVVEDESPLDLSCKKYQEETVIEIKEVLSDENEITIEKKSNVAEFKEDIEESDKEIKKGETCDREERKETDTGANDAGERIIPSSENQMQGYFGSIMMRALKRLWSESKPKLDGDEAVKAKPECTESSDDDSGKYFQPSSVTTLKHVPQVDSPDRLQLPFEDDPVKNVLSSSSSSQSLETALCELMQRSSDAFKHGGDIFQHFDKIIKRELMVEIEKQSLKCNDDSTITETKMKENPSASSDLNEAKPDEQTSEAVAVCTKSPTDMLSEDEEIDDSQNLVIVESSVSPKPSPDSQVTESMSEKDSVPALISTSNELLTSIAADSSVYESFISPEQMYEKAARDAAQKAAREAARLTAQKVAQSTSAMKDGGKQNCAGDVIGMEMTSVEPSFAKKPSPVPSPVHLRPNANTCTVVQGGPSINSYQLPNNRRASTVFVKQPHAPCPQKPQYMGEDVPCSTDEGEDASEPVILNHESTDSSQTDKLQRMQSEDASSTVSVRNCQSVASSSERPSTGSTFHIIPQTTWQAQAQESNANKVKLIKVTCGKSIPIQAPSTVSGVPNAQDIQKQLQKSPIVLLPKLVCVPGQTYSQSTPVIGTQTYPSGNIVPVQKDSRQSVKRAVPILPAVTIQVAASNAPLLSSSNSPLQSHSDKAHSPELIDTVSGPFRIIQKTPIEQTSAKKACVSAFIIIYKKISLPGVLRSGVPFVPPRLLQDGMFTEETFENFCHALQEVNIMQRYMTVLERSALLNDLKHSKISSCKLVSLEEFHQKYDNIKVLMQINKMT